MAIKQLMLSKKIEQRNSALKTILDDYAKIEARSKELERAIDEASTDEEVDTVEKDVDEVTKELDDKKAEKEKLEKEIADLEAELKKMNDDEPGNGGADDKKEEDDNNRGGKKKMNERQKELLAQKRASANAFLHTRGAEKREGLKSDELGILIPEEIDYIPRKKGKAITDLAQFVTVLNAKAPSGKYMMQKRAQAKMHTVEELAENPELAKPEFIPVAWSVDTYRGMIAIAQETIDDSEADLVSIVNVNAEEQRENTSNDLIAKQFQTFTPVELTLDATDQTALVDGIKEILNVKLDPTYEKSLIVSQSFFQILDTLKDKEGRYLLQPDVKGESDGLILNKPVYIVLDEQMRVNTGTDEAPVYSTAVGFVGDAKYAVLMPKRAEISAKWADDKIYGEYVATGIRFGVTKADPDAGFFVTLKKA